MHVLRIESRPFRQVDPEAPVQRPPAPAVDADRKDDVVLDSAAGRIQVDHGVFDAVGRRQIRLVLFGGTPADRRRNAASVKPVDIQARRLFVDVGRRTGDRPFGRAEFDVGEGNDDLRLRLDRRRRGQKENFFVGTGSLRYGKEKDEPNGVGLNRRGRRFRRGRDVGKLFGSRRFGRTAVGGFAVFPGVRFRVIFRGVFGVGVRTDQRGVSARLPVNVENDLSRTVGGKVRGPAVPFGTEDALFHSERNTDRIGRSRREAQADPILDRQARLGIGSFPLHLQRLDRKGSRFALPPALVQ